MNSMKRQKDKTMKDEPPRLEGVQYAIKKKQRAITNSSRMKQQCQKEKRCSVVDVSDDESKVQCDKGQNCISIWNVRSMKQGILDMVKQVSLVSHVVKNLPAMSETWLQSLG